MWFLILVLMQQKERSTFLLDLSCRDLGKVMDRKGGPELTCALPQSPGQWGCEHGTVWRGQIPLYRIWEYKLPSWPARESAEWWGNLNWNKVRGEPIGQPRSVFTLGLEFSGMVRHRLRCHCNVGMNRSPNDWIPQAWKNYSSAIKGKIKPS